MMTQPFSEGIFIQSYKGIWVSLLDVMWRDGLAYYRHPNGGGFVAENSYVPSHIFLPYDWTVFENTRVLDDADLCINYVTLSGNTSRVSEVLREEDAKKLLCEARYERNTRWYQLTGRPLYPYAKPSLQGA